jgi:predicted acylesterase/phospholipase RssA
VTVTPTSPFAPVGADDPGAVRRSLVLAGGGMRVSYQAGALAALEEAGLRFHHVDGTSGGTMNLSMMLTGQGSAEMGERWRALDPRSFSTLSPWRDYVRTPRWPGLGDARGLRDKVFPHLGIDVGLIRRAAGITGTYNVCNFATKTAEVVEHPDVDLDLLVAAVSLPVLMPVVTRSGTPYTDAVWVRDSNVPEAVGRGSDEVWLVWCIGNTGVYHNGLFRQYVHMIETAANGALGRDLAYTEARWPGRPVRLHVIKPQHPIALDTAYYFGRVDASAFIGLGYQDACRYLDDPKPVSPPWDHVPTRMSEAPPGATVRLVLGGPFAIGDYSPVDGARVGVDQGTSVALHLLLQARNGAASESVGPLSVCGDIRLPGQRAHTLIEEGTAELGREGLTLRLGWPSGEGPCSLIVTPTSDGRAHAVTLTNGSGHGVVGAVVGAGTVSLGWRETARALASLHATDCATTVQAVKARASLAFDVLRHGHFFPDRAASTARYRGAPRQSDGDHAR